MELNQNSVEKFLDKVDEDFISDYYRIGNVDFERFISNFLFDYHCLDMINHIENQIQDTHYFFREDIPEKLIKSVNTIKQYYIDKENEKFIVEY